MNRTAAIEPSVSLHCPDRWTPMRVVDDPSEDGLAVCIDRLGELRLIETERLGSVLPGETLLVHADVAIARVPNAA